MSASTFEAPVFIDEWTYDPATTRWTNDTGAIGVNPNYCTLTSTDTVQGKLNRGPNGTAAAFACNRPGFANRITVVRVENDGEPDTTTALTVAAGFAPYAVVIGDYAQRLYW